MNFWIDTHAHIYLPEFDEDRGAIIDRSREHGVMRIAMPNIDRASIDSLLEVESKYPETCFAMMGLHPCSVKKDFEKELYHVEDWLDKRKFVAVGEIGTDLYWDKSLWDQQVEAFTIQVNWAKKYQLPIVIHCRESLDQTITILQSLVNQDTKGIFHCFTGTPEQAKKITEMGFLLGIGGVLTFKNGGLDKVISMIDQDRMVLETDSPYLTPVPHRGKRNEPSYIPLIAQKLSDLIGIPQEVIQQKTTSNALTLFNMNP